MYSGCTQILMYSGTVSVTPLPSVPIAGKLEMARLLLSEGRARMEVCVCVYDCMFRCVSFCLSVSASVCVCICMPVCVSVCVCVYLCESPTGAAYGSRTSWFAALFKRCRCSEDVCNCACLAGHTPAYIPSATLCRGQYGMACMGPA